MKTDEEEDVQEKIEFKIGGDSSMNLKSVKPINLDNLIKKPNLFQSIFK